MDIKSWIAGIFGFRAERNASPTDRRKLLREFVYLDEVSLRSLLSSQTGEVTEGKSEQRTEGEQIGADGTIGIQAPFFSKGELASRYQTSNSSTLQTSRKATVQSWFRELHALPDLQLIKVDCVAPSVVDIDDLLVIKDKSIVAESADLTRGQLVEFRVILGSDPVFHLGTMATEFSGIVEGSPEMFVGNDGIRKLNEFQPINNALQRLMAGLIPIRAEAVDYVTMEIDGGTYMVHRDVAARLDVPTRGLEIVGVTEHLAYWKDIRRVLFSRAEFTILARIARTGLQEKWTPVKLVDLFRVVAPDFDEQLNLASKNPFSRTIGGVNVCVNDLQLGKALTLYSASLLSVKNEPLSPQQLEKLDEEITQLQSRGGTASGQREAFREIYQLVAEMVSIDIGPIEDAALREQARASSGLNLFPMASNATVTVGGSEPEADGPAPLLLDVEIVAIYW